MIKLVERIKRVIALGLGAFVLLAATHAGAQNKLFDHANTGFDLTGGHKFAACESCHVNGQFAGTPRQCVSCHSLNGRFNATPKPIEHIFTSDQCDSCHNMAVWNAVPLVDHAEVFGACASCHNNNIAPGKPINHIPATDNCSDCHSDLSWQPVHFNHDGVIGQCVSCHDGGRFTGKPADHLITTDNCESCHTTMAWQPANFDHDETPILANCAVCHNGTTAVGKPVDHIPTSPNCYACHTNPGVSFAPVMFVDHDEIEGVENNCASCHEPDRPPPPHVQGIECNFCHTDTTVWRPSVSM